MLWRSSIRAVCIRRGYGKDTQETLRFIASRGRRRDAKTHAQHVSRLLELLNASLPQRTDVTKHYEGVLGDLSAFMSRGELSQKPSEPVRDSQLAKKLLQMPEQELRKIRLDGRTSTVVSLVMYYRLRIPDLRKYEPRWIRDYHSLHVSVQRLLWRALGHKEFQQIRFKLGKWTYPRDSIIVYQALYKHAHDLPMDVLVTKDFTKNQLAFVYVLCLLARKNYGKRLVNLAQMSVQTSLLSETIGTGTTVNQYKMCRGLQLELAELAKDFDGTSDYNTVLEIAQIINEEGHLMRSQMLRFVRS